MPRACPNTHASTARRPGPASCWSTSARPRHRRAQALRRYLKEFLSDPRVVEIPRAVWWLHPERHHPQHAAGKVGRKVRRDLDRRGLAAQGPHREAGQAAARLARRTDRQPALVVDYAMRYGDSVGRRRAWRG
ncbi:MAG: hypothetical protein MZW92_79420 [Comamonadaceae bacterium]|nr:hypothetical protein [Comamonadaceae bacterium]